MPKFNFENISVFGVSTAVPVNKLSIDSFSDRFGCDAVNKFKSITGIKEFHQAVSGQTASDLGFAAAQELFAKKNVDTHSIKLLVFVSQSPDYRRPNTACVLQKRLGLSTDCACFEINLGCCGFVYGMNMLCSMMAGLEFGQMGLLILGETTTKITHPMDRSSVMLNGDSGAAILFEKRNNADPIQSILKSDGSRCNAIVVPAGGFRHFNAPDGTFMCKDGNERSLYNIFMDGTAVFTFAISDVPQTIAEFLTHTNSTIGDYDLFLLHQANLFIMKQIIKKTKIPDKLTPVSIDRYGNTGCVSIPLTLSDCCGNDIHEGKKKIFACGFGGGLEWGVSSFSVKVENVLPIVETDVCYNDGVIDLLKSN